MNKIRKPELAGVPSDDDTPQLEQSTGDLELKFIDHDAMTPFDLPPTSRLPYLVSLLERLGQMNLTEVEGVAA